MQPQQLILYGADGSQPSRTVSWLLRIKNVDFKYEMVVPGRDTKSKEFLEKNPWSLIPVIQHSEGFYLSESGAIITYLADYYGWTDLYPSQDLQTRAKIQSWLHWHHRNSRELTMCFFGFVIRPNLPHSEEKMLEGQRVGKMVAKVLNEALSSSQFLVGDKLSLADFCVFADVGQCHKDALDLFDFSPYPYVEAWIHRMRALPHYAETHSVLPSMKKRMQKFAARSSKL